MNHTNTVTILLPNGEQPPYTIPERLNFALIEKLAKGELEFHHAERGKVNHQLSDLSGVLAAIKKGFCDFPRQKGGNPELSLFWRYMALLDFPIIHIEGEWTNIYCQHCSWLQTEDEIAHLTTLLKESIPWVSLNPRMKQTISYKSRNPKALKWRAHYAVSVLSGYSDASKYEEFKQVIG